MTLSRQKAAPSSQTGHEGYSEARAQLTELHRDNLSVELHQMAYGAIVCCRAGEATIRTGSDDWKLAPDTLLTLFPGDAVQWHEVSRDFHAEVLWYDAGMLREASLQIEHAVYSLLRRDRLCSDAHIVRSLGHTLFDMLRYYFHDQQCDSIDRIVTLLLSAFFLGFYDYVRRNPLHAYGKESQRTEELFNLFMEQIEHHCKEAHSVSHYARELCITRKYLCIIVERKTGKTPKKVIDEYLVLQLKLALRTGGLTVKQIADEFHFTDASFLVRYFKSHTGMTPTAYRKSLQQP